MFDNITFIIDNYGIDDFYKLTEKIQTENLKTSDSRFQTDWQNLRINYYPNEERVKVSNSIHKFYNAEIEKIGKMNHNDFSFNQMAMAVQALEETFRRPREEMKLVGKFEYGLNIDTGILKPYNDIIERYRSVVTTTANPFHAFYNPHGKPYGKFCSFTQYTVKCYDKGKQMQLSGRNLLRYEIVHPTCIKTREILGKKEVALSDLTKEESWQNCFSFVGRTYDKIRLIAFPTGDISTYSKLLCYSDNLIRKDYQKKLLPIANELKTIHDNYKLSNDNPHAKVRLMMFEKFDQLLKN